MFGISSEIRVRVRSCSIFFAKSVFAFVHVRPNTNEHACSLSTCSCSFIPGPHALTVAASKVYKRIFVQIFMVRGDFRIFLWFCSMTIPVTKAELDR